MGISKRSYEIISHALWQMKFPPDVEVDGFLIELQKARDEVSEALSAPPAVSPADAGVENQRDDVVPGEMYCAKCNFKLLRRTLNYAAGNIGAGTSETELCPNGCGNLWPVTWKKLAYEQGEQIEFLAKENAELREARASHPRRQRRWICPD